MMNRSEFLRKGALSVLGAGVFYTGLARGRADDTAGTANRSSSLHLAMLSDTHIAEDRNEAYRGFKPFDNLTAVIKQALPTQPEMAVLAGDAARLVGNPGDYQRLKELIAPLAKTCPIAIGLGNHDDRKNFNETFQPEAQPSAPSDPVRQAQVDGKHVSIVEHPVVRVIVLDSLLYVDRVAGLLGKAQRNWLAEYLTEADDRPTMLVVHHTLGDGDGDLLDVDRMMDIVKPHRNVKAVFYGHSHRYFFERDDHLHLVNLPAIGYNFRDDQPVGWVQGQFFADRCELKLHTVAGNQADNGSVRVLDY